MLVQEPFAEPFQRLLRDGITDGRCVRAIPPRTPPCCFSLVSWTYVHYDTPTTVPPEEASTRVVSLVLGGVLRSEN
jgi:hypothetical protein